MISEAIDRVIEIAKPNMLEFNGLQYSDKPLHLIAPPKPSKFHVTTLLGLLHLFDAKVEDFDPADVIVHVVSPTIVTLEERTSDDFAQRDEIVRASWGEGIEQFKFGQFLQAENFVIALQALFEETGDREEVLKIASNLGTEAVSTASDDGISQRATFKSGVVLQESRTVKSRVSLAPRRTFTEVEQPASNFIFRLRGGAENSIPLVALFEADGGAWRLEAAKRIAKYFEGKVGVVPVIV